MTGSGGVFNPHLFLAQVILFNLPLAAAFDLASLSALFAATTAVAADFSDFFGGICLNGIGAGMSF